METIKELENEYKKLDRINEIINDKDSLYLYLDEKLKEIDKDIEAYNKELNENIKYQLEAKIRNLLFFIFAQEETSFYDEDNALIYEIINLMYTQRKYIQEIQNIIDDSNYKELMKLYSFLEKHYDKNYEYLEMHRRQLEGKYEGISFVDYSKEDKRQEVDTFFHKKISYIIDKHNIEKKKKIC